MLSACLTRVCSGGLLEMHARGQVGLALPRSAVLSGIDLQLKGHHQMQIFPDHSILLAWADLLVGLRIR